MTKLFPWLIALCGTFFALSLPAQDHPNVILIVADDLGYGDVGFNGNEVLMTPNLDQMAQQGMVLDRFYAAAPLCSPTRGSILTGRHPFRFGVLAAHTGGMRPGELTLAEAFQEADYRTGFFGKWHLGWLRPEAEWSGRGRYSPPWHHGFDETFATKSAVPTWDPTKVPEGWTKFGSDGGPDWTGSQYVHNGELATENLAGDDSRIIMDRVIPFIEAARQQEKAFFTCVWFHTPHLPVVAGPEYLAMYPDLPEGQQHFYGAITAMDEQIGRLRQKLRELGIEQNTVIWFTSDNGPSGPMARKGIASAGPYRGTKHTMYEGGLRVPTLVEWPGRVEAGRSHYMSGTVDIFSTLLSLAEVSPELDDRPMDGLDLSPAIFEGEELRPADLGAGWMRLYKDTQALTWIDHQYKLIARPLAGETELYDLMADPEESVNLAAQKPELVASMQAKLNAWMASCQLSRDGMDYQH